MRPPFFWEGKNEHHIVHAEKNVALFGVFVGIFMDVFLKIVQYFLCTW